jgi:hypothetical protein
MTTVLAFDLGECIMDDVKIKIPVDHFFHIRPEKTGLPSKTIFINLFKCLEIYPVRCRFQALL